MNDKTDTTHDDNDEPEVEGFVNSGIQALIAVTQLKASNANEAALEAADKQRGLFSGAARYPVPLVDYGRATP